MTKSSDVMYSYRFRYGDEGRQVNEGGLNADVQCERGETFEHEAKDILSSHSAISHQPSIKVSVMMLYFTNVLSKFPITHIGTRVA